MQKNKYSYIEIVKKELKNRGQYKDSKEVINFPFVNRFIETWHSMFRYTTNKPTSNDRMLGNFYIECDVVDFNTNRNIMITAVDYLHAKYGIPYIYFNFFLTNRSIWCYIPYKVFGIKPQKNLNVIYGEMAKEINDFILKSGYKTGIDLSIYKWNGLIHALGSYLPQCKSWVSKFEYGDLERVNVKEELRSVKWDYGFTFDDVKVIDKCVNWVNKVRKSFVKGEVKNSLIKDYKANKMSEIYNIFIKKIRENELIEGNRNNTVYTYALILKRLGKSIEEAKEEINEWLRKNDVSFYNNEYSITQRTIKSAYRRSAKLSLKKAKSILDIENINVENRSTFIIPRSFIDLLNENKCHWRCYKLIIEILYSNQILNCEYNYDLSKEKYKKNVIAYFEKLQKLGLISYTLKSDVIKTKLIEQKHEIYKNHSVIPNSFIESKHFKTMNNEIKVFCEILRSSFITNGVHYYNIKLSTICSNISLTMATVIKSISKLRKLHIICFKYITFGSKSLSKEIINKVINIVKRVKKYINNKTMSIVSKVKYYVTVLNSFIDNKMIYSIKNKIFENIDKSMDCGFLDKNICGTGKI